jgi:hypothetical protein
MSRSGGCRVRDGSTVVIPNITRGGSVGGVLRYLVSQDPANKEVHVNPRLVAGDSALMALWAGEPLGADAAREIGSHLDQPRRMSGTEITVPVRDREGHLTGGRKQAHVWHCSLSLHPDEPALSDERWGEIADRFVARMGFVGEDVARCRWVAVLHGQSAGGCDHVHLVVALVREDGSKASVHSDRPRAQQACRELEQQFGLRSLEARERGAGERGLKAGEQEADRRRRERSTTGQRRGEAREQSASASAGGSRRTLERIVRGCAAAARDEVDFVKQLRAEGVLLRPRYAQGDRKVIEGYSVALRVKGDEAPVWYGGGRLSRELTLPRLRENWLQTDPDLVAEEWKPRRGPAPGPRTPVPATPETQQQCLSELARLRKRLLQVPAGETATWAHVATEAAGIYAAWSLRTEPEPGPLAETARILARSGQIRCDETRGRRWRSIPPARYSSALLIAAKPDARAALEIFRQLTAVSRSIADMHEAVGELDRARELNQLSRQQLATVTAELAAQEVREHNERGITPAGRPAHDGGRGRDGPGR